MASLEPIEPGIWAYAVQGYVGLDREKDVDHYVADVPHEGETRGDELSSLKVGDNRVNEGENMEIYSDLETPSADPQALVFRVVITGDNIDELPTHFIETLQGANTCSEILAVLTTIAIQLDRKNMEFQGALREATALKAAEVNVRLKSVKGVTEIPLCPMRECAEKGRCPHSGKRPCVYRPDTLENWEARLVAAGVAFRAESLGEQKRPFDETFSAFTAVKRHIEAGDDNAFAGEIDKRSGPVDRRFGDRRLCQTVLAPTRTNPLGQQRRVRERRASLCEDRRAPVRHGARGTSVDPARKGGA